MTKNPPARAWVTTREIIKQHPGIQAHHIRKAVEHGRLPEGVKLGPRTTAWPAEQIAALFRTTV